MSTENMSRNVMEYMVWVVEITARKFFANDKCAAYKALKDCGIWDIYVEHYDVTHSLGSEIILDEIKERISGKGAVTV